MTKLTIRRAILALSLGFIASNANAADVIRHQENARQPYASSIIVPPGYSTYYIAGGLASVADPNAQQGSVQRYGDTATQTASALSYLKNELTTLGLTFGDVVEVHVFLAGDPAKDNKMDFGGMNSAWSKEFGTPTQPNKPIRATVQVAALARAGTLVEIEMVAVKKAE